MNLVAQPSRLRVAAASRRQHEYRAGRPLHSHARTPALHPPGSSWSHCMRKNERGLSINRPFEVPALAGPDRLKAELQTSGVPTGRFMVPMHAKKRKEALHEPTVRSLGFSRSGPPEGGTPNKWRPHGTVHGPNACAKRMEAFHAPERTAGLPVRVRTQTGILPAVTLR